VKRNVVRVLSVAALVSVIGVGCDASTVYGLPMAKAGKRCTGGFARDSARVLQCNKGKWTVNMAIDSAIAKIDAYNAAEAAKQAGPAAQPQTFYANCTEVRDAGKAPIRRGEPGYDNNLDRDDDGIACEV